MKDSSRGHGDSISSQKKRNKIIKISFFAVESILLLVVIVCAIILNILDGVKVIPLPDESVHVNNESSPSAEQTKPIGSDETVPIDVPTKPDVTVSTDTTYPTPFAGEEYTTIVIFGLDGRASIDSIYDTSNSDVMILVSINNKTGQVRMASVYRDVLMKLYNSDPDATALYDKANAAMCYYGALTAVNTLNLNLDLKIDHYVTINWSSAVDIINALGGVDYELKKAYYEINNDKGPGKVPYLNGLITELVQNTGVASSHIPEEYFVDGTIWHADGVQAVAYMRLRRTDSDINRTMRQREIIQKIVEKAKAADLGTLLDIWNIVKANVSMSLDQSDLLGLLAHLTEYKIEGSTGYPKNYYGGGDYTGDMHWMMTPVNVIENVRILHEFLYDQKDYEPSYELQVINEEIRHLGLFDEDWNLTIETQEY